MKKWIVAVGCMMTLVSTSLFAQEPSSDSVAVSTAAEEEHGMTDRPGSDVFVTLTRSAYPTNALPTTAEIVTPKMFKKFGARNAGEAVARQTSVQTLPTGQLGSIVTARIRGSSSSQTLILIDGRPVGGVALGTPDLSEIPVENIDHIEILRGGVSALYGPNALGGVINVITKRATYAGKPVSTINYEQRSYETQMYRLDFGSRYGPLDYYFSGNQQWESGFRDNSDARTHNIGGNLGYSMGAAGKLLLDVSSYRSRTGLPGQFIPPIPTNQFDNHVEKDATSPTARQETGTDYIRSSYILPLPANSLLTLRAFGSQRDVDFDDTNNPDPFSAASNLRNEQSKGAEAQINLPLGLTVGGNFIHDREDNTDRLTPSNSFIASIENWGVFAQEEFHWNRLALIPSGRYDHNSQVGDTANPRVQLTADATPWLRFSGAAGRSFRAPTIDELFLNIGGVFPFSGNPDLRPETAWTYDAGFELHADSASLSATYFRANVSDLIQTKPITFDTVVNIGTARRQGAEIQLGHTINQYVKNSVNYTYLENMGIPSGFDHLVVLSYSPRHTVNWTGTLMPTSRWKIDSTLRYQDVRYSGNNQTGTKLGNQLLWDMRTSYQLRQLEIYLGVNDITNKRYEEQAGFPLPGITAYGGLSLKLWG